MLKEDGVIRYTSRLPSSESESWDRLIRYRGFWELLGFGYWILRKRETGDFVGVVGFGEARRGVSPSLDGLPEAGWLLTSRCQGKGYGNEAIAAACAWLDRETSFECTRCMIDPENLASLKVAARNGFVLLASSIFRGEPVQILERRKPV